MQFNGPCQENQIEAFRYKAGNGFNAMSRAIGGEISEQEMRDVGKETPKAETYNPYGDAARKVKIKALRGT